MFTALTVLAGCAATSIDVPAPHHESKFISSTTDAHFERDVIDSDEPVLVDFYASWCRPCQMMQPILEDVASQYDRKVKVVQLDIEKNPRIAERYRIEAIPRVMLFKNGDLIDDVLGLTSRERLLSTVERTL